MAINKVVYGATTLIDITDTTATESDVEYGKVFYKADGTRGVGTKVVSAYSFVGMVAQGTNLTTEASVKAIYGDSTSWTLISSVALATNHVFGNEYALGLSDGSTQFGLLHMNGSNVNRNAIMGSNGYGATKGTSVTGAQATTAPSSATGVATKTELGNNPEYSGLIADTITVYSWERTA